ncbi:MAG: hypothetical protein WCI72_02835 [archaeon]
MSLNTTFPDTPQEVREERRVKIEPLLVLLDERPHEARTFADKLVSEGVPPTSINSSAYDYIKELKETNPDRATEIANYFSGKPYHWNCWLTKPDITKFKKQPNYD